VSTHEIEATSATAPTLARWQTGWEIPVTVSVETVTPEMGEPYEQWTYQRVVVPSLAASDIQAVVERDFDGDASILAEAQAIALLALTPQVTALTDAVDLLILESLGG
jgi:hypothetical protein